MSNAIGLLLVMLSLVTLSCSSDDPTLERRGGPLPDGMAGASGAAGSGNAGDSIAFCDALKVIRAKCQRCHQEPPKNGASPALLSYADTQAPYAMSSAKYSDVMLSLVESGVMPDLSFNDPPTSLKPPVEPLTADEKATLLGWLRQGALPRGGTDCP